MLCACTLGALNISSAPLSVHLLLPVTINKDQHILQPTDTRSWYCFPLLYGSAPLRLIFYSFVHSFIHSSIHPQVWTTPLPVWTTHKNRKKMKWNTGNNGNKPWRENSKRNKKGGFNKQRKTFLYCFLLTKGEPVWSVWIKCIDILKYGGRGGSEKFKGTNRATAVHHPLIKTHKRHVYFLVSVMKYFLSSFELHHTCNFLKCSAEMNFCFTFDTIYHHDSGSVLRK